MDNIIDNAVFKGNTIFDNLNSLAISISNTILPSGLSETAAAINKIGELLETLTLPMVGLEKIAEAGGNAGNNTETAGNMEMPSTTLDVLNQFQASMMQITAPLQAIGAEHLNAVVAVSALSVELDKIQPPLIEMTSLSQAVGLESLYAAQSLLDNVNAATQMAQISEMLDNTIRAVNFSTVGTIVLFEELFDKMGAVTMMNTSLIDSFWDLLGKGMNLWGLLAILEPAFGSVMLAVEGIAVVLGSTVGIAVAAAAAIAALFYWWDPFNWFSSKPEESPEGSSSDKTILTEFEQIERKLDIIKGIANSEAINNLLPARSSNKPASQGASVINQTAQSIASGGVSHKYITINIKEVNGMNVKEMQVGSAEESVTDSADRLASAMLRILSLV